MKLKSETVWAPFVKNIDFQSPERPEEPVFEILQKGSQPCLNINAVGVYIPCGREDINTTGAHPPLTRSTMTDDCFTSLLESAAPEWNMNETVNKKRKLFFF